MKSFALALALVTCMVTPTLAQDIPFWDDFEGDLSQWNTQWGIRVTDPLDPANGALSFVYKSSAACTNSRSITVPSSGTYVFSFRHLALVPEAGGEIYLCEPVIGDIQRMPFALVEDGSWHTYTFEFEVPEIFGSSDGTLQIVVDELSLHCGGGIEKRPDGGQALFDDIRIERAALVSNGSGTWGTLKASYQDQPRMELHR